MRIIPTSPIVAPPNTSDTPLQRAVADVLRDWRKVFAHAPNVVSRIECDTPTLLLGRSAVLDAGLEPEQLGDEEFVITILPTVDGRNLLAAYGGGDRGDIYAVYAFSERVLGVDPFWFWTDNPPTQVTNIAFEPEDTVRSGQARFRYRGWFTNDEDLLTGWAPDPLRTTGISLDIWDRIYETILRSGGNFVIPGTFLFPDEPQIELASKRGLIIGQHHLEVLGLNTYRWPEDVPYSYTTAPDILRSAWEDCVRRYGDKEVLWSVGYRGKHDQAFWYDDPAGGSTMAERGQIISRAIADQVAIVRKYRPHDDILLNLWMEGVALWESGHLYIPDGVMIVWPDDGHGVVTDGGNATSGHGIYYHPAMYDHSGNQLTDTRPVPFMNKEIERLAAAGATEHLLLNVSDVKPYVLTIAALMEMGWRKLDEPDQYYLRWATRQFGAVPADRVAELVRCHFAAAFRFGDSSDSHIEDNAYYTWAERLVIAATRQEFDELFVFSAIPEHMPLMYSDIGPQSNTEFAEYLREKTGAVQQIWDELEQDCIAVTPTLPIDRQDFFTSYLTAQVTFQGRSNAMLHQISQALLSLRDGDVLTAHRALTAAARNADEAETTLVSSEYGKWAGFYTSDLFVAPAQSRAMFVRLAKAIQEGNWPILKSQYSHYRPLPDAYPTIKRYQEGQTVELSRK